MNDNHGRIKTEEQKMYFKERAGTDEARFHLVPHDDEGWAIRKEGEDEPVMTIGSRPVAVKEAKRLAEEAGTIAYIHNEEGRIEEQHNFQEE